jgi:membrane protein
MVSFRRLWVLWFLMKDAFKEFRRNDPLRFGASTAFFTTFALPPILVILTNLLGILYNAEFISQKLMLKLQDLFGSRGATQLYEVLQNIQRIPTHWSYALLGMLFLIFVSTTLFIVVQKSLNELWHIQPKNKGRKLKKLFKNRAISLAIIIVSGILFMISLLADSAVAYIGSSLENYLPTATVWLIRIANQLASFGFVTVWFAFTFKFLPDARIRWRPVWVGAAVTAGLFTIGKFILNHLLINSNLGPIYGPSASILLIMLFVFYSSMILFYGASFTRTYANYASFHIRPKSFARLYQLRHEKEMRKAGNRKSEQE